MKPPGPVRLAELLPGPLAASSARRARASATPELTMPELRRELADIALDVDDPDLADLIVLARRPLDQEVGDGDLDEETMRRIERDVDRELGRHLAELAIARGQVGTRPTLRRGRFRLARPVHTALLASIEPKPPPRRRRRARFIVRPERQQVVTASGHPVRGGWTAVRAALAGEALGRRDRR